MMLEVKFVICVVFNYYILYKYFESSEIGKIFCYGWGRDYYKVMYKKLKFLVNWL